MGRKYTTQTSSTYADNTPADDGSRVATNQISVNLIRTNYTDPIKNLADAINAGLVDHFDNGPRAVTSTDATVATDYGKILQCSGTFPVSLLAAATAGAGYPTTIKNNGTGTITVTPASGDTVDTATDATILIGPGDVVSLIVNSTATGYMTTDTLPSTNAPIQTATGTSVTFSGIKRNAKRLCVMFDGVSTNGTSDILVQLGDAGGIETSGYIAINAGTQYTAGFGLEVGAATESNGGFFDFALMDKATNTWTCQGIFNDSVGNSISILAGIKPLSDTLTQLRITTVNGTDAFDTGKFGLLVSY